MESSSFSKCMENKIRDNQCVPLMAQLRYRFGYHQITATCFLGMQWKSDFYVPHFWSFLEIHQDVFRSVWISFINIL